MASSFQIIVLVWIVSCVLVTYGKPVKMCPRIGANERQTLEKKLMQSLGGMHWSFWMLPPMQVSSEQAGTVIASSLIKPRHTFLYGPKSCRVAKANVKDSCPVHYVMEHDHNRIPQNVVKAKCSCDKCRNESSTEDRRCSLIYTYTKVLRRTSTEHCGFNVTLENIPVACACLATN